MDFKIVQALSADLPDVYALVESAGQEAPEGWFVASGQKELAANIRGQGFILLARDGADVLAGCFMVHFPGNKAENLGLDVGLPQEELVRAAHMDTAVVAPAYRGHGLQRLLAAAAEERLAALGYRHLLCTIHPDNRYSLCNMKAMGYGEAVRKEKYGGLPRLILYKSNSPAIAARQYPGLDAFLLSFPCAEKDFKPEWQWLRYRVAGRLFAALCTPGLQYRPHGGRTMLILKCDPALALVYRQQYPEIVPGFYSDKRCWNSLYLDGELSWETLSAMVRQSYALVFAKLPKGIQKSLPPLSAPGGGE